MEPTAGLKRPVPALNCRSAGMQKLADCHEGVACWQALGCKPWCRRDGARGEHRQAETNARQRELKGNEDADTPETPDQGHPRRSVAGERCSGPGEAGRGTRQERHHPLTQVFGDGVRPTAVALEYARPVQAANLSRATCRVEGRTITGIFVSTSAAPADRAAEGRFISVALSPEDACAILAEKLQPENGQGGGQGGRGPGHAGDILAYDMVCRSSTGSQAGTGAETR